MKSNVFMLPTCNLRRAFLVVDAVITTPRPPDLCGPPEGPEVDVRCAHLWRPRKENHSELVWPRGGVRKINWRKMNEIDRLDFEEQIVMEWEKMP